MLWSNESMSLSEAVAALGGAVDTGLDDDDGDAAAVANPCQELVTKLMTTIAAVEADEHVKTLVDS
jgi:hypothetical protein